MQPIPLNLTEIFTETPSPINLSSMRFCFGILLSLLCLPTWAQSQSKTDLAIAKAKDFVHLAIANPQSGTFDQISILKELSTALENPFQVEVDDSLDGLGEAKNAWYHTRSQYAHLNRIRVSSEAMDLSVSMLAEVFIHENTHLLGYDSEETVTEVELLVMFLAKQDPYINDYILDILQDRPSSKILAAYQIHSKADYEAADFRSCIVNHYVSCVKRYLAEEPAVLQVRDPFGQLPIDLAKKYQQNDLIDLISSSVGAGK